MDKRKLRYLTSIIPFIFGLGLLIMAILLFTKKISFGTEKTNTGIALATAGMGLLGMGVGIGIFFHVRRTMNEEHWTTA